MIKIFGDGCQLRDYIYVEDLADAFIRAAVSEECVGEIYNIGSGIGTSFIDMVKCVITVVGKGHIEHVPWPDNYINVETGNYITNITKICSQLDWQPKTDLLSGIQKTHTYYKKARQFYW